MLPRRHVLLAVPALLSLVRPLAAQARGVEDAARALGQLHALTVSVGGEEVLAIAPRGPGLDRVANVKSVSKTLVALLTGIAIDRGVIEGTGQRVLPLLGRSPVGDARDELTIGDLLSMRAGLGSTSGPNYGAWIASSDWVDAALGAELVSEPGGRFVYSTGGWHVLGAALSRAASEDLLTLARAWLGEPLGIDFAPWARDPQGRYLGGNEMALSPRDLRRIGEAVLGGGTWRGTRVVPESWIDASWRPRARSPWSGDAYGYGWFLTRFGGHEAAYGRGYGGQMLVAVPGRDMAIAVTSDPTLPARSGGYFSALRGLVEQVVREA